MAAIMIAAINRAVDSARSDGSYFLEDSLIKQGKMESVDLRTEDLLLVSFSS